MPKIKDVEATPDTFDVVDGEVTSSNEITFVPDSFGVEMGDAIFRARLRIPGGYILKLGLLASLPEDKQSAAIIEFFDRVMLPDDKEEFQRRFNEDWDNPITLSDILKALPVIIKRYAGGDEEVSEPRPTIRSVE